MNNAMRGTLALLLSSIKKQNPDARSVQAILGNVNSRRLRRPKVSIVYKELCQLRLGLKLIILTQTAGKAKTQFTRPNPKEARSADLVE